MAGAAVMPLPPELRSPLLAALDDSAIVAVTDTAGGILYANERFCRISGYDLEALIGANHRLLRSDEHPAEFFRQMYRTIAAGRIWRGTICNRSRTGQLYWVDTTITPVLGADGRPRAYVAIRTDVTQHKRLQQELEAARAAAVRAGQARERFLANLSHELRTPLTSLIGFSDVLARSAMAPDQRDSVAAIRHGAEALRALVSDVLALAQGQSGGGALAPGPTDLGALAEGCLTMVSLRAAEKGVTLRCAVGPEVPAAGLIDSGRLRQVLINLLGNAVKFTEAGEIGLTLDWADGVLRGEVTDTGCGFAPDEKERLFAAFEQAVDDGGRHVEGAGLGLPICRGLVSAMGGVIDADSAAGQGARFWFTAPCPAVAVPAVESEPPPRAGAAILVAEDSPEIQRLLDTVLTAAGHRVQIAPNGRDAVDALRLRPFDLCLMDLRMPVMGGEAAVRAIRSDPDQRVRATPVVAVSAEVESGDQDRFRGLGFDDALAKPLNIGRLLGVVDAWSKRADRASGVRAA